MDIEEAENVQEDEATGDADMSPGELESNSSRGRHWSVVPAKTPRTVRKCASSSTSSTRCGLPGGRSMNISGRGTAPTGTGARFATKREAKKMATHESRMARDFYLKWVLTTTTWATRRMTMMRRSPPW